MAHLGESSDVILEGFTHLLPTTLQVPRVVGSHMRALEIASEDLLEVLPTIDRVPQQVI
jgi:hypothetical protein